MSLLIDQHDTLDYCDFNHENLNVYQLSEFQLVFSGYTRTQDEWEPDWAKYAPYQMDIYNPTSFPVIPETLIEPGKVLNYRNIHITDVFWRHFIPYGEDVAAIGHCNVNLLLCQVKMEAFSSIDDLRNPEQLGEITLNRIQGDVADRNRFIYPKTLTDLKQHKLKDRLWLQSDEGNLDIHRNYGFHTALTREHILTVTFEPRGHWEQGTAPTPSQLEKVFISFWDFMDHLTITETPEEQKRLEPGKTLRGEQKRIAEEIARDEARRKNSKPLPEDDLSGW
jgi:hypothetical protein